MREGPYRCTGAAANVADSDWGECTVVQSGSAGGFIIFRRLERFRGVHRVKGKDRPRYKWGPTGAQRPKGAKGWTSQPHEPSSITAQGPNTRVLSS